MKIMCYIPFEKPSFISDFSPSLGLQQKNEIMRDFEQFWKTMMRARLCSQSRFLNVFSMESYFWLEAHYYVYCLQRLTRPPRVWKKGRKKSCILWTSILSNPMKLWGLAFVVVHHHHHYHHQPHHHDHHRQHSPPLASSPGGAQSDKVLSSASMSTRVAPRDHVNSPALFIIRNGMWTMCWVQQNNNIFREIFIKT